jgi:hypothetical protein
MNYKETEIAVLENLINGQPGNKDLRYTDNEFYDLLFSMKAGGLIDFEKSAPAADYNFDAMKIEITSYGKRFYESNNPPKIE